VSCSVSTDGDKTPIALFVCFASELNGVAGAGRSDDVNVKAAAAHARDGRSGELGGAAAASRGINDSEEAFAFH